MGDYDHPDYDPQAHGIRLLDRIADALDRIADALEQRGSPPAQPTAIAVPWKCPACGYVNHRDLLGHPPAQCSECGAEWPR